MASFGLGSGSPLSATKFAALLAGFSPPVKLEAPRRDAGIEGAAATKASSCDGGAGDSGARNSKSPAASNMTERNSVRRGAMARARGVFV
eukprot:CAMPEP_0117573868 /NCGR_PEP_ID=MMETSP0784-20121206/61229_1 /TAXON_ID=39447 /ORGANISM="" /LENGTH=89 /DNA_ID=CAMNT_0005372553 /DNA_START=120 /DNA_END=385 /DNA_ORIENTATION=-